MAFKMGGEVRDPGVLLPAVKVGADMLSLDVLD